MGNWHREKEYHCDCCDWDGCSVLHKARLSYQGTSDIYHFEDGRGNEIYLDKNTMKTFLKLAHDPIFNLKYYD